MLPYSRAHKSLTARDDMASHYTRDHSLRPRNKKKPRFPSRSYILRHLRSIDIFSVMPIKPRTLAIQMSRSTKFLNTIPLRSVAYDWILCVVCPGHRVDDHRATFSRKVTLCGDIATRSRARPEESVSSRLLFSVHVLRNTQIFIIRQQTNTGIVYIIPF